MIKKYLLIIFLISLGSHSTFAQSPKTTQSEEHYKKVHIGELTTDNMSFVFDAKSYPLYHLLGATYIPIRYLEAMGMPIQKIRGYTFIDSAKRLQKKEDDRIYFKEKEAYSNENNLYIGNLRTYSIRVAEEELVPVEVLSLIFNITVYKSIYLAEEKVYNVNQYINIDEHSIRNKSKHMLRVTFMHLFWNGEKHIEHYEKGVLLEPYQKINKNIKTFDKSLTYITTLVLSVNDIEADMNRDNCYGQKNIAFFKRYSSELKREKLDRLFPVYKIKGTLKYDIGTLKKGEQTEVWRAEKRVYYVIKTEGNKNIKIPWDSIVIEGDRGVHHKEVTSEDIEDYISIKGITSKTNYLIWTNLYKQRTYVLKGSQDKWKLKKTFVCSSGKNTYPTPAGLFEIQYTIPYFGMEKNYRCKNAAVFFRDYMFHSILFDTSGKYIKSGKYQLGQRVSHGCVRLSEEDSAWLYRHVPVKTTVWIQ